ncbi:GGDEF domain-containing protein [Candidatus Woesearchaeota archaeon]|nr:GGDEF domain-containing protein [Candidatus Woesearchaeota archaeon]
MKTRQDLEGVVIKVSVGIGRNMAEAEYALFNAKQRKHECRQYNIVQYDGTEIICPPIDTGSDAVQSYLTIEQKLAEQNDKDGLEHLENLKHDPMTGLLNRTGYSVEVKRLTDQGRYNDRIIMILDGDDMKKANALLGYEKTDTYLVAIGKALKNELRQDKQAPRPNDILLNRKNDSGGDEFVIDISCSCTQAENIARRYVDAVYNAQVGLSIDNAEQEIDQLRQELDCGIEIPIEIDESVWVDLRGLCTEAE